MSAITIHEREQDQEDFERYSKRPKLSEEASRNTTLSWNNGHNHILPLSHALLGVPLPEATPTGAINFSEKNVGISEYVGRESARVQGIIKQRYVSVVLYFPACLNYP
jgi:tRNA pseudouridine13 synthase